LTSGLPAERGNDVLGEQLDLAYLLLPRHEALIEEPTEPLEVAAAADGAERGHLGLDLVHRPRQAVLDLAHPLYGPFRRRQRRVRIERVLGGVLGRAERLPEAEAAEVILEPGIIGVAQEGHGFGLRLAEVDGAEGA